MRAGPEKRAIVREWMVKADHDLLAAAHTLRLGRRCPTDVACFHAQQCVEKYLKAALVWRDIEFPRIHDIAVLLSALPVSLRPRIEPDLQERLTHSATRGRYPRSQDPSMEEARLAVRTARFVRRHVRRRIVRASGVRTSGSQPG